MKSRTLVLVASTVLFGCGGATPPAATADPTPPPANPEPAPPEPAKPAPKQVSIETVEIEGGGIEEKDVRSALESVSSGYEKCYADALAAAPDAGGVVMVTLLYVKGEKKSVSASYSGPGSDGINPCFQKATDGLGLAPAASAERSVISIRLKLAKSAG